MKRRNGRGEPCVRPLVSLTHLAVAAAVVILLVMLSACSPSRQLPQGLKPHDDLVLVAGTSLQDSGLLDRLVAEFTKQSGIRVKVLSVGSGEAIALGRRGEADVLLTNSPGDERRFVADGYGVNRKPVAHNDFVLVGPTSDPAKVLDTPSAVTAFRKIASRRSTFLSRGDRSGAEQREREVWNRANIVPGGSWYVETGSGQAQTLRLAEKMEGYTLSDIATYMVGQENLKLGVMVRDPKALRNTYSVMVVNPEKFANLNNEAAREFADFVTGQKAQRLIVGYGREKYGRRLYLGGGD